MGLFASIKKLLGGEEKPSSAAQPRELSVSDPEPEPEVPEISAADLMTALAQGGDIVLLDCRETSERRMVHIPDDIHMPMNEIPGRLEELAATTDSKTREIVVYCAAGMRSFGVAHFLNEQGFTARNLRGGIAHWEIAKGTVQRGETS